MKFPRRIILMWGYYGLPRPFPPDSVKRAVLMRGDDWRGDCPPFWTNDINGDDHETKIFVWSKVYLPWRKPVYLLPQYEKVIECPPQYRQSSSSASSSPSTHS